MFRWFSRRRHQERTARDLYGSIVAASRRPDMFTRYHVPDTVEGRLELLILHMFLLLDRLAGERGEDGGTAQALVDLFFADMDTSMREMGVGDMAVPGKMRALATAVNARWDGYRNAARGGEQALAKAIGDAFADAEGGKGGGVAAPGLARYLRFVLDGLKDIPVASLDRGIADVTARALRDPELSPR